MKYTSLVEADCRALDTVISNTVDLVRLLQFHATPNFMPGFIVFQRSPNTTTGLAPTRLGSTDMVDGTWYMDLV